MILRPYSQANYCLGGGPPQNQKSWSTTGAVCLLLSWLSSQFLFIFPPSSTQTLLLYIDSSEANCPYFLYQIQNIISKTSFKRYLSNLGEKIQPFHKHLSYQYIFLPLSTLIRILIWPSHSKSHKYTITKHPQKSLMPSTIANIALVLLYMQGRTLSWELYPHFEYVILFCLLA